MIKTKVNGYTVHTKYNINNNLASITILNPEDEIEEIISYLADSLNLVGEKHLKCCDLIVLGTFSFWS